MDSTLVAPRNTTFTQKVTQEEPEIPQVSSENIFDRKISLGLATAILAPSFLSVLVCGVLAILSALNIISIQ